MNRCSYKNEANPSWKGDKVGYTGIHMWVYRQWGKAIYCENDLSHIAKRFEWANISGQYKRERSDWKMLCKPCHAKFDKVAKMMSDIRKKQEEEKYLLKAKLGKSTRIPYATLKKRRYLERIQNG